MKLMSKLVVKQWTSKAKQKRRKILWLIGEISSVRRGLDFSFPCLFTCFSAWVYGGKKERNMNNNDVWDSEFRIFRFRYCREVVVNDFLERQETRGKLGGVGKIVQIDESKIGKRKFNRGRMIEGHWILGMIEDGSEDFRIFVCPDNIRSSAVLVPLIEANVEPGTIIHTDCWKAYDCLSEHGFVHNRVNHSDPDNRFVGKFCFCMFATGHLSFSQNFTVLNLFSSGWHSYSANRSFVASGEEVFPFPSR